MSEGDKPRYAFLTHWAIDGSGGVNRAVLSLMSACERDGTYRPVLIETDWGHAAPVADWKWGATRIRLRLEPPLDDRGWSFRYWLRLPFALARWRKMLRSHRIEVLNVHFVGLGDLTIGLLKRLGLYRGRLIFSFHGSDARAFTSTGRGLRKHLLAWMLRGADAVVPCSRGVEAELAGSSPGLRPLIRTVHNGVDAGKFATEPAVGGRKVFVNIGTFNHAKGHDRLLKAFRRVLDQRPGAKLMIVGRNGPAFEATRSMVEDLGLGQSVSLLVDQPHESIPGLLRSATAFVLSTPWTPGKVGEGFSLALLEAAAAGLPLIASRTCGVDELIENRDEGWVVPPESDDALTAAMVEVLDDPRRAAEVGERLRRKVQDQFTWDTSWRKYLAVVRGEEAVFQ